MVAPDYAADLSLPILDRGRNAKEGEIGSSTMCRPNYFIYLHLDKQVDTQYDFNLKKAVLLISLN